jgi:hypothetical protein
MLPLPYQSERFGALHDVGKRAGSAKKPGGVIWRRTCRYSLPQVGVVCVRPRIAIVDIGLTPDLSAPSSAEGFRHGVGSGRAAQRRVA